MKTKVEITENGRKDVKLRDYKKGDRGYIDGYVTSGLTVFAMVVIEHKIYCVIPHRLKVI